MDITFNTELIDRLERWERNLPPTDTIPITDSEVYDLAHYISSACNWHYDDKVSLSEAVEYIRGGLLWGRHRIEII